MDGRRDAPGVVQNPAYRPAHPLPRTDDVRADELDGDDEDRGEDDLLAREGVLHDS